MVLPIPLRQANFAYFTMTNHSALACVQSHLLRSILATIWHKSGTELFHPASPATTIRPNWP